MAGNNNLLLIGLAAAAYYFLVVKRVTTSGGATCTICQLAPGGSWDILRAQPGMMFDQQVHSYPTQEAAQAACAAFLAGKPY